MKTTATTTTGITGTIVYSIENDGSDWTRRVVVLETTNQHGDTIYKVAHNVTTADQDTYQPVAGFYDAIAGAKHQAESTAYALRIRHDPAAIR